MPGVDKSEGMRPNSEKADVARASRPLVRGHPARAFLAGAGRSRDSGRDARATTAALEGGVTKKGCRWPLKWQNRSD